MRPWIPLLLWALLLAPTAPASHPDEVAPGDVFVNVVSVSRVGCGDDGTLLEGGPDYRVQVFHEGGRILDTGKAQDRSSPLFAALARLDHPVRPVTLTFQVDEAEPGGFLGTGTRWRDCDASPGPGKELVVEWGGGLLSKTYRGGDGDAVELRIVVGETAPAVPALSVGAVGATGATLSWDADANGLATGHRLRWWDFGETLHEDGAAAGSHALTGLCDNADYGMHVVRDADPWFVRSDTVTFRTDNLVPDAPTVRWADRSDGNLSVAWYSPTWHDVREYQVHVGGSDITPADATLWAAVPGEAQGPFARHAWAASAPEDATHVLVRVVDTAGAHADSPVFSMDGTHASGQPGSYACPNARTDGHQNPFSDPDAPVEPGDPPRDPGQDPPPQEPQEGSTTNTTAGGDPRGVPPGGGYRSPGGGGGGGESWEDPRHPRQVPRQEIPSLAPVHLTVVLFLAVVLVTRR